MATLAPPPRPRSPEAPAHSRATLAFDRLHACLRRNGDVVTSEAVDALLDVGEVLEDAHAHAHALLHRVLAPVRAPELLGGKAPDARADVWALGAVLHTMLAGATPFAGDTPSAVSLSVGLDEAPSLAGVPDELAEIVERALARDPSRRPASVEAFTGALVPFASDPAAREHSRRKQLLMTPPPDSEPTLMIDDVDYEELAREQRALNARAQVGKQVPAVAPTTKMKASELESLTALDSEELISDEVAPSVRSLTPSETPPPLLLPTIAKVTPASAPTKSSSPRRALAIAGVLGAAACVAALVLVGTEGGRLSRSTAKAPIESAPTSAAANAPPPEASPLGETASAPSVVRPALRAADLPAAATPVAPVVSPRGVTAAPAKPRTARGDETAAPAAPPPAAPPAAPPPPKAEAPAAPSSPAPSGSDDLRRFLDDRR